MQKNSNYHQGHCIYKSCNYFSSFVTESSIGGCLPLWFVGSSQRPLGLLDALAAVVTGVSIVIEATADRQKREFLQQAEEPTAVCERGLWAYSRHPNYLGEIGFWVGLFLFGLAADPSAWWTGVGAASMLLLFVFISIPMLERRQLARRSGYRSYVDRVAMLLPWRAP